jgi:hypothetical protein
MVMTITAEQLQATSLKVSCQKVLDYATAQGCVKELMQYRRHPDTCVSTVMSVEEADRRWVDPTPSLLHDCGFVLWSNSKEEVNFLTDDAQYGWKVLKERGWYAATFFRRSTAYQSFDSFREFLDHYDKGYRTLESEEELLAYLNQHTEE